MIGEIADAAADFVKQWRPDVTLVIPVTPSKVRANQPVFQLGAEIAKRIGARFATDAVIRREALPELKNIARDERTRLLKGAHDVQKEKVRGEKILLFDDLFQSGATMNAICCSALLEADAAKVTALTLTRTQS